MGIVKSSPHGLKYIASFRAIMSSLAEERLGYSVRGTELISSEPLSIELYFTKAVSRMLT